jgi:hypothetical protein
MENKKTSLSVNSFIYGVVLGASLIIFDLIFYIFNARIDSPLKYLNMIIVICVILFGTITFRNKQNNGYIKYGKSFLSCFLIALYGGIIFAVYYYLFVKFFDHSIIVNLRNLAEAKLEQMNMPEEQVEKAREWQKKMIIPAALALGNILSISFWGAIFSLIISIFIKKEDNSFESATSVE